MNTFTHEEEKLVLVIAACFLMATAVLLCCPEYDEKVTLSSVRTTENTVTSQGTKTFSTGKTPIDVNRPEFKKSSRETINLSNKLDPNFATYQELETSIFENVLKQGAPNETEIRKQLAIRSTTGDRGVVDDNTREHQRKTNPGKLRCRKTDLQQCRRAEIEDCDFE